MQNKAGDNSLVSLALKLESELISTGNRAIFISLPNSSSKQGQGSHGGGVAPGRAMSCELPVFIHTLASLQLFFPKLLLFSPPVSECLVNSLAS